MNSENKKFNPEFITSSSIDNVNEVLVTDNPDLSHVTGITYSPSTISNYSYFALTNKTDKKYKLPGIFVIQDEKTNCVKKIYITKIIYARPATIVFWSDGVKTVTKCAKEDVFSSEVGLAMCILKRLNHNKSLKDLFSSWLPLNDRSYSTITIKDVRARKK